MPLSISTAGDRFWGTVVEQGFNVGTQMMEAVAALGGEQRSRRPGCASPVLTEWFLAWADVLGDDAGRQLAPYVEPLARSRGSAAVEAARQWLVAEWLLGATLPACLDAAGAGDVARDLAQSSAVRSARDLAAVASFVEEAARAARHAHDSWRQATAALSGGARRRALNQPPWRTTTAHAGEPRSTTWHALSDGVRAAVEPVRGLVTPAEAALGIGAPARPHVPTALRTTPAVITDCLLAVAWSGCYRRLTTSPWSWNTASHEAQRVGASAATRALQPLHITLGRHTHEIARRTLTLTTGRHGTPQQRITRPITGARAS